MKNFALAVLFAAPAFPASASAQPSAVRLDRAAEFSAAAAAAGSADQARALSSTALDSASRFDAPAVDASGAGFAEASRKEVPAPTFAPARAKAAEVPSPALRAAGADNNSHAGAFIVAGLLSPLAGAAIGALLGGGPGAVVGALIGTAVGVVLCLTGLFRALRYIFKP